MPTDAYTWGAKLPTLPGRRLDLRALTVDDAPAILEVFGDPEVMRFWSSPPQRDLAEAEAYIAQIDANFAARQFFQWGICRRDTGKVCGTCTLFQLEMTHRRAEVGIALGRDAWGQGLATETLDVLIGFAFGALDLHRLEADTDPQNERSLRLLERQGFQREGYLRERWRLPGQVCDGVFLGLLRPEWTRADAGD